MSKQFFYMATLVLVSITSSLYAQTDKVTDAYVQEQLAKGRVYTFVTLLPGKTPIKDETVKNKTIGEHVKYIFGLKQSNALATAGPIMQDETLHGIYIFNEARQEEVKKLLDADPAISKGHFGYKIYTYFSIPGDALAK